MHGLSSVETDTSNLSQKRSARDGDERHRAKRAKYTSAACNECKRCKVKCIRMESEEDCQRCTTMKISCIVVPTTSQYAKGVNKEKQGSRNEQSNYVKLSNEIRTLREQVVNLTKTVATLVEKLSSDTAPTQNRTSNYSASPAYTQTALQRNNAPQEPQFVGPTRSAFSFNIAETSLSRMGISRNESHSTAPSSAFTSREATPEPDQDTFITPLHESSNDLLDYSCEEIVRLLGIYQEEIACVHPIVETKVLVFNASDILQFVKQARQSSAQSQLIGPKDVHILKIAVATALFHEAHGKNEVSDRLIASVERDVGVISVATEVELKDIQIMGMLSLYFCHTSEELYSWRAIGRAARQALEMGLHRKQSLIDNFPDPNERQAAVHIFWVVYELDRRWSFGTSLSFALNDRDIDSQLPEPGKDCPYLKAMVAYARLCSRVWEALPPYGSSLQLIPRETEDYLDFIAQNWLESVPQELQFKHPRLGLAPRTQPRQIRRLRTLLYLRGNYVRTLVHRHHVLTPDNIKADMQNAILVVDIAKDSILVLVHLNETSDIYIREQSIYHYYLLSALAVVLLAVCHAPNSFAEACRDSFISGIELVKGFSRHCTANRRLWKSIRGLLPVVKSLGSRFAGRSHANQGTKNVPATVSDQRLVPEQQQTADPNTNMPTLSVPRKDGTASLPFDFDLSGSMPDNFDMGNDLMDLYDVFGSAATYQSPNINPVGFNDVGWGLSEQDIGEISRHFQDLI